MNRNDTSDAAMIYREQTALPIASTNVATDATGIERGAVVVIPRPVVVPHRSVERPEVTFAELYDVDATEEISLAAG